MFTYLAAKEKKKSLLQTFTLEAAKPCRNELDAHLNQFHSSPLLIELSAKKAFWQLRLDINLTAWLCLQASEPNTRLILQPNVGHMLLPKKPRDTVSKRPDRQANKSQSASTMHCTAACSQGYQHQAALPKMNRLLCKGCKLCRISASQVEKVIRLTVTVVFVHPAPLQHRLFPRHSKEGTQFHPGLQHRI